MIFAFYGIPGGTDNRTVNIRCNLLWPSCGCICHLLCDLLFGLTLPFLTRQSQVGRVTTADSCVHLSLSFICGGFLFNILMLLHAMSEV